MPDTTQTAVRSHSEAVLPDALIRLFPEAERRLEVEADTVNDLIEALDRRWPGMAACLRDSRPAVRKHITILVGGERAELSTRIPSGAIVHVLTAISGG